MGNNKTIPLKPKQIWDEQKVRDRLLLLLERIKDQEQENPPDHAGGGVPVEVGIMFLLERMESGKFFGTLSITVKGTTVLKPVIEKESVRFHEEYSEYLL